MKQNQNKMSIFDDGSIYGREALKRLSKFPVFFIPAGVSSLQLRFLATDAAAVAPRPVSLAPTLLLLQRGRELSEEDKFERRRSLKEEVDDDCSCASVADLFLFLQPGKMVFPALASSSSLQYNITL